MEIVLGVDPGTVKTGWGLVQATRKSRLIHVAHGTIESPRSRPQEFRLRRIFEHLEGVIREYRPRCASLEKVFFSRNVQSALKLGQVRGVVLLAAERSDLAVNEYASVEIKKAVAGYGHASKEQVQQMVRTLLALSGELQEDAADALAAAICHLHQRSYQGTVATAVARRS